MSISRELMGRIVDEVFDGAIEDASVIEEIHAIITAWQPPETAPKDREILGDFSLIYEGETHSTRLTQVVKWYENSCLFHSDGTIEDSCWSAGSNVFSKSDLIGWMDIPPSKLLDKRVEETK